MAKITDPDSLTDSAANDNSAPVYINTSTKTIKLVVTGSLSNTGVQNTNGVTLKCLYSFLKEQWRNDPNTKNLAAFDFPMVPITDESFELVSGWDFLDNTARYLIRDAGWAVKNTSNVTTQIWSGIIGLGAIETDDQLYYQVVSGAAPINVQLPGQVNQAVQVYLDANGNGSTADGGDFDYRTYFKLFGREQGQIYGFSQLSDIGVTSVTSQAYRFPIATGADLKVTHIDTAIDANSDNTADVAPYTGMSITYYATPQVFSIGGTNRNFGVVINGNSGTAEQIYEFVQWSLRRSTDIDAGAGTLTGKTADALLEFVGDTLKTKNVTNSAGGGTGVYINNYNVSDINRLVFRDNTSTERTFPYTASLTINFGANLVGDASAKYWVYFTTLPGASNDFGESGAVLVQDASAVAMAGNVSGGSSITKTFAYDTNVQGGRTAATDAAITVIGIGLTTGQYVKATGTIARSTSNSVSLVAALERNYLNP